MPAILHHNKGRTLNGYLEILEITKQTFLSWNFCTRAKRRLWQIKPGRCKRRNICKTCYIYPGDWLLQCLYQQFWWKLNMCLHFLYPLWNKCYLWQRLTFPSLPNRTLPCRLCNGSLLNLMTTWPTHGLLLWIEPFWKRLRTYFDG